MRPNTSILYVTFLLKVLLFGELYSRTGEKGDNVKPCKISRFVQSAPDDFDNEYVIESVSKDTTVNSFGNNVTLYNKYVNEQYFALQMEDYFMREVLATLHVTLIRKCCRLSVVEL